MKKLVIALTAVAAFTAPALAADMAPRYAKAAAPVVAPVANWTGCYVGAGGGGAYANNDHNEYFTATGVPASASVTTGLRGWFGTVGAGCDYQVDRWVFGLFGDYDFKDVRGDIAYDGQRAPMSTGTQKLDWQWSIGGRVGYVIVPQLLTYFSGGYTQAHFKSTDLFLFGAATPTFNLPGGTRGGWFIGAGDEYALSFMPGLFWKTEYRYSEFDRSNTSVNFAAALGGGPSGFSMTEKVREHSVRSELVYRFNWGGPVVAKY